MQFDDSELEALQREILGVVQDLPDDLTERIALLASDVRQELLNGNFRNRTGNLRRSMATVYDGYSLRIRMLYYGYFLSFGVVNRAGSTIRRTFGLSAEVAGAFNKDEGYIFGTGARVPERTYGVDARDFYPRDISERIINIIDQVIATNLDAE